VSGGERLTIPLSLERWAYYALAREAAERGTSTEDLAAYAVAYFLADADSGRIARHAPLPDTDAAPGSEASPRPGS